MAFPHLYQVWNQDLGSIMPHEQQRLSSQGANVAFAFLGDVHLQKINKSRAEPPHLLDVPLTVPKAL